MTSPRHDPATALIEFALAQAVDHAVMFFSADAKVIAWRGAAARLFGHSEEQAIGLAFAAIFTAADLALGLDQQEWALALSSGRSEDDRWHVRRDGGTFWASGVLQVVLDARGEMVALCKIVRDRTDVRTQIALLQNQLHSRTAELERRERVVVAVAHELRNPMMPIAAAVELLRKNDDPAVRLRSLEVLERQFAVLRKVVDDLADVTRVIPGRARLATQRLDARVATSAATDAMRAAIAAGSLGVRLVMPHGPIYIDADPPRLQQMLLNLLGNAVKYTPAGGHIAVSVSAEGDMAVIRVEDDGVGIAPEVLPRIFELFTREERSPAITGLGVGLAVVQDLAQRHGGGAEARSPGHNQGSMFTLRLPLSCPA